jgi:hypothetical protein
VFFTPEKSQGKRRKCAPPLSFLAKKSPTDKSWAFAVLVVECGRGFKADLQSLEATLRHLSAFLEIVRFTSWQSSDWR